ncbi:hypothetical protein ACFYO1_42250 [Nocardia sp. NPDC006044]|uniref:hypothetical protein n=1 Tax=Nocardia sp. NPDC006044 TaxID=3364306 RepID=UPI00368616B9
MIGEPTLDESHADELRDILDATGARAQVERLITTRLHQALRALDQAPFPPGAGESLRELAATATARTS